MQKTTVLLFKNKIYTIYFKVPKLYRKKQKEKITKF